MYTLYLNCKEGLQEEMILGSLFELCTEKKSFLTTINHLFTSGLILRAKPYFMNGTQAVRIQILTSDLTPCTFCTNSADPYATDFNTIVQKIRALNLPEIVKNNAIEIFHTIHLDQNSQATQKNYSSIPHPLFTYPALYFILGSCLLLEMLHPEQIIAELPVHYDTYLNSVPPSLGYYFLKFICDGFTHNPSIKASEKGVGVTTVDDQDIFAYAYLGPMQAVTPSPPPQIIPITKAGTGSKPQETFVEEVPNSDIFDIKKDTVLEISCNLDDMTGEQIGYAFDLFLKEGALDVFYTPIYMKKNRPGILFTCLCRPIDQNKFTKLFFLHTTTRGIRYRTYERSVLESSSVELDTIYGKIHQKNSYNQEIKKSKLEYEDVKKAAELNGVPLLDIYNKVLKEPFS